MIDKSAEELLDDMDALLDQLRAAIAKKDEVADDADADE